MNSFSLRKTLTSLANKLASSLFTQFLLKGSCGETRPGLDHTSALGELSAWGRETHQWTPRSWCDKCLGVRLFMKWVIRTQRR